MLILYVNGIELGVPTKMAYFSSPGSGIALHASSGFHQRLKMAPCPLSWRLGPLYLLDDVMSQFSVNAVRGRAPLRWMNLSALGNAQLFALGPSYDGPLGSFTGTGMMPVVDDILGAENISRLLPHVGSGGPGARVVRGLGTACLKLLQTPQFGVSFSMCQLPGCQFQPKMSSFVSRRVRLPALHGAVSRNCIALLAPWAPSDAL